MCVKREEIQTDQTPSGNTYSFKRLPWVLLGPALTNKAGENIGNVRIVKVKFEEDAWVFARSDAFAVVGVVSDGQITRMADRFSARPITEPMRPRRQN